MWRSTAALGIVALACSASARAAEPVNGAAPSEYDCLIEKGQALAALLSGPERAALDLARSRAANEGEIKAAEAKVEITRKKLERAEELVKKNFVSANARDEAEADYRLAVEQLRVAQENRRLAELEVKRAEEVLAQREIKSPV